MSSPRQRKVSIISFRLLKEFILHFLSFSYKLLYILEKEIGEVSRCFFYFLSKQYICAERTTEHRPFFLFISYDLTREGCPVLLSQLIYAEETTSDYMNKDENIDQQKPEINVKAECLTFQSCNFIWPKERTVFTSSRIGKHTLGCLKSTVVASQEGEAGGKQHIYRCRYTYIHPPGLAKKSRPGRAFLNSMGKPKAPTVSFCVEKLMANPAKS